MIVLYDNTGKITQTFMFVAPSLEVYAETVLDPNGIAYTFHDGNDMEINNLWVKDGVVVEKPALNLQGDIRQITADGIDTLTFTVDQTVKVKVIANNQIIATETVEDGTIEFAFDHPGNYTVLIEGQFPTKDEVLNLEAI